MMLGRNRKRYFVGRRNASKNVPLCFAKKCRDGGVVYDTCVPRAAADPADREEAAAWMARECGGTHDDWYDRLWNWAESA